MLQPMSRMIASEFRRNELFVRWFELSPRGLTSPPRRIVGTDHRARNPQTENSTIDCPDPRHENPVLSDPVEEGALPYTTIYYNILQHTINYYTTLYYYSLIYHIIVILSYYSTV